MSEEQHHILCNFWGRPREGCRQCEGLYKEFPLDPNKTIDDQILEKYPEARIIK